jgi:hypothetical protein
MKPLGEGKKLDTGQKALLATAATAYASTQTGIEKVKEDAARYGRSRKPEIAAILRKAVEEGARQYLVAKEATAAIEAETIRKDVTRWASQVPNSPKATTAYYEKLSEELQLSVEEVRGKFETLKAEATVGTLEKAADIDKIRFLVLSGDRVVGTPFDEATLDAMAEMERLAWSTRLIRRTREATEEDGTRWVRYENDSTSEVIRAVQYDQNTRTARISIATKDSEPIEYTYHDVSKSLIRALVSARSMGAFYAYVFAPLPNGGSLGNKTGRQYSYAVHASNGIFPIATSSGPVPRKFAKDYGFITSGKTPVKSKKATV